MVMGKRPPLDEQKSLWEGTVATEGVTTGAGAITGDSFIDAGLAGAGATSFVSMLAVIYPGQPRNVDSMDITAFDNVTGEVTLAKAYKGVAAAIPIGVPYKIVTFRFVPAEVAALTVLVNAALTRIGVSTDAGDLATLFAKHKQAFLGTHTNVLVVVHDTSALDADLDTALQAWLLDTGSVVTLADPTDVAGNLEVGAYDLMIVSASCVAADVANLANLRYADVPIICHSADIAASAVFNMGATPHTEAAQTQIEIVDNTVMWVITQALGDLTVTTAANIYVMNTKAANAITIAEEATGTGNHLTVVRLLAGDDDGAATPYAAFYDHYFVGIGDYTNMNAVWKAVMEDLVRHCIMEKRYTEAATIKVQGLYVENIPDTDFALAAIDTILTNPPPAADAENRIVDLDAKNKTTYALRSLWVNVTDFGTGTLLTFQLWTLVNGVVTSVDSVPVAVLGIQNLMDIFGLPEVHANGIWITVITDVGNTGACSGTFNYAEAKS